MRVLQVTGFLPPHFGGVESHVTGLSRQLAAMGIEVDVAASVGRVGDGVGAVRCPPYLTVLGNPVMRGLGSTVRRGGYDIVHLHSPPQVPALQASRACSAVGVPYVLTYHCDGEVSHPVFRPAIPLFMGLVGNRLLEGASRIVVTTGQYASTSPYLRGRDCSVIPTGVDVSRFHDGARDDGLRGRLGLEGLFVAGFVGRLVRHKGVDTLLAAIASMDDEGVGCLVVGDGPCRRRLESLADAMGLERVVFTGQVDDANLPDHYSAMDALVLPSRSREEAFGLTLLEAMASGIPVVSSRIPGPSEVAGDGFALTFERDDADALAECLVRLEDDAEMRARMGAAARAAAVGRFSWKEVAARVARLYEEVLVS